MKRGGTDKGKNCRKTQADSNVIIITVVVIMVAVAAQL